MSSDGAPSSGGLRTLRRMAAPRPPEPVADEVCQLCAVPLGERHGHLADTVDHHLLCTCRPCYLLFAPRGAGGGRYRAVGEEVRRVDDLFLDDARWDALQVPVDLVFLFRQTGQHGVLAFYPGPGGATQSELGLGAWQDIVADNPVLDTLEPDVEAVLLRRVPEPRGATFSCHLVPVDLCYELVGTVRLSWAGLGGGPKVWREIGEFFAGLDAHGRVVSRMTVP